MDEYKNIFIDKVWYQFSLGLSYNLRIRKYVSIQRRKNKIIDGFILFFSLSSILCACFKIYIITIAFTSLTAIAAFLKDFIPFFKQNEAELLELDKISTFFSKYQLKMEDIYDNVRFRNGDLQTYEKKFVKLKAESAYYVTETNKYYKTLSPKYEKEIDKKINEYVARNYPKNSSS